MQREKKKNMGTKQFIFDMIQSYIDNKIPQPLVQHAAFEHSVESIGIGIDDYYTAKASYEEVDKKFLTISFYNGYLVSDKETYNIYMTEKDVFIIDESDESTFVIDSNNNDVIFNISLKYNFTLTLEDLNAIHKKFIELLEEREITKLEIFYTVGEEKQYGY